MNATQLNADLHKKPLFIPERVAERARTKHTQDPETGCHTSTYSQGSHGYAQIGWNEGGVRTVTLAHRIVWASTHGTIPDGMTVDHTCKNRTCVNVDHLRLLSNFENARRTSGRDWSVGKCVKGHANAFLVVLPSGKTGCFICARYYWKSGSGGQWKISTPKVSKVARLPKTHCKNGHPWVPENIYARPDGRKECTTCKEAHAKKWHAASRVEDEHAA